jgi:hypothetical protein
VVFLLSKLLQKVLLSWWCRYLLKGQQKHL